MDAFLIELIRPIELVKKNCKTINFEEGTVLKVIMRSASVLMVTADSKFNFTIPLKEQNTTWQLLDSSD